MVRDLVDSVFVTGDLARLNMLAVGLLALFAVQAALGVVAGYWLAQVEQRLVADLHAGGCMITSPRCSASSPGGTGLVSRVSSDVAVVETLPNYRSTSCARSSRSSAA